MEIAKMMQAYACYSALDTIYNSNVANDFHASHETQINTDLKQEVQKAKEFYESVTPTLIQRIIEVSNDLQDFEQKLKDVTLPIKQ